jgi:hypothetical protein
MPNASITSQGDGVRSAIHLTLRAPDPRHDGDNKIDLIIDQHTTQLSVGSARRLYEALGIAIAAQNVRNT